MATAAPDIATHQATRTSPRWHVVLLDDDQHTYDYVVRMLVELFRKSVEEAYAHAVEVDGEGRTIVETTSRERAELKQEQIHAYGPDPLMANSKGSMRCVIEPER